MFNQEF